MNVDETAGYPEGYNRRFLVNAGLRLFAGLFVQPGMLV